MLLEANGNKRSEITKGQLSPPGGVVVNGGAIYVTDVAKAKDPAAPDMTAWVEARKAWYVLGSKLRGGMGFRSGRFTGGYRLRRRRMGR